MPFVRAIRHGLQEAYGKPTTASKIMLCVMTDITPAGPHAKSVSFARSGFAAQADSCRMVEEAAQAYLAGELRSTQSCIRMVSRISHIEKENLVRQLSEPSASGQRLSTQDARWDAGCAFFSTIKHSHHEALQQAYSAYPGIDWAGAQELYGLLRKLDPMKIAAASPDLDRPSTLQGMPGAHVQYFGSVLDKQAQQRQIASQIVPKLLTWDKFLSIHGKSARSLEQLIGKEAVEDGFQPCRQMLQAQMPQESERAQLRKLMLHFWQQFEGMSPSEVVLLAKAISHCCEGNLLYGLAQQPDSFTPSKPPQQHFWLSTAAKSGSKSADQISPPCETCWVHFMHDLRAMYS